jgi:RNA polymerase sigma-70 factor (ECF subfamily)
MQGIAGHAPSSHILRIRNDCSAFLSIVSKKDEQMPREANLQMKGQRQTTPAELACDLPFLLSLPEAQLGAGEIETEVMTLFEQYRVPLLCYTGSFGVPVSDAEEIVQEVFLFLFRHLRLGRSRRNLRGWIFRVAHNLTLKQRLANHTLAQRTTRNEGLAEEHADPAPGPEEQMSAAQRRHRLQAVVQALPENDQHCLRLRAEGLRYREIATVLGMSLGAVSISLTRSLARLARADSR